MMHNKKRPISRKVNLRNFELLETASKYSQIIYNNGETDFLLLSSTYHNFVHTVYYVLCKMYGGNNLKFKSPVKMQFNYDLQTYRQADGSYRFPRINTIMGNRVTAMDIDMLQVMDLYDKLVKVDNDYIFYYDDVTKEYVIDLVSNKK